MAAGGCRGSDHAGHDELGSIEAALAAHLASSPSPSPWPSPPADRTAQRVVESQARPAFQCAGKRHCSQMRSCAEATFYLRNCPGVLSDGDGDGIPCEDQWCGH
ncbi:MAG: excalibur calcium-binding domain-containing protein [Achromobacter pestifer]